MVDWIQGHPLGRKFKALVCHDGVFSTLNQWSTEELFFPIHDFEGTFYENREGYEKWDPAKFVDEWATPQLVRVSSLSLTLDKNNGVANQGIVIVCRSSTASWITACPSPRVWRRSTSCRRRRCRASCWCSLMRTT